MTDERHEKALEAAARKYFDFCRKCEHSPKEDVSAIIATYLAGIVPKEPVAWRYRFKSRTSGKWTVQKNKPDWYEPRMLGDVELEPLFARSPNHFTNGE